MAWAPKREGGGKEPRERAPEVCMWERTPVSGKRLARQEHITKGDDIKSKEQKLCLTPSWRGRGKESHLHPGGGGGGGTGGQFNFLQKKQCGFPSLGKEKAFFWGGKGGEAAVPWEMGLGEGASKRWWF